MTQLGHRRGRTAARHALIWGYRRICPDPVRLGLSVRSASMYHVETRRGSMRLVLKMFKFLVVIVLLGILGFGGWLTFSPPDGLLSASAYAAKMVCSNVFI